MKRWWKAFNFAAVVCSGLCVLGLPLLVAWLPSVGLGWFLDERISRPMFIMFLAMYGLSVYSDFRCHKNQAALMLACLSGILLFLTVWHRLPRLAGWPTLAGLIAAWAWNRRLLQHRKEKG